ncbi:MAG TPA: hypothetical protein VHG08_27440, partial [Longimicrobium sp.]|nr:hypothetical protein [Longimicrobium sp.]
MKFPRFGSDAFHRGLVRSGTAVWLVAGIALLAATVRTQWPAPAAASTTAAPLASPESARSVYQPAGSIEA